MLLIANTYGIVYRCDCNKFIRRSERARRSYGFARGWRREETHEDGARAKFNYKRRPLVVAISVYHRYHEWGRYFV